jgi:hypothetical protein
MAGEKYLIWTILVCGMVPELPKGVWPRVLKQVRPRHGVDDYRKRRGIPGNSGYRINPQKTARPPFPLLFHVAVEPDMATNNQSCFHLQWPVTAL